MDGMVGLSVLAATPRRRRGAKGDDGWGRRGKLGGEEGTVETLARKVESRWPSRAG